MAQSRLSPRVRERKHDHGFSRECERGGTIEGFAASARETARSGVIASRANKSLYRHFAHRRRGFEADPTQCGVARTHERSNLEFFFVAFELRMRRHYQATMRHRLGDESELGKVRLSSAPIGFGEEGRLILVKMAVPKLLRASWRTSHRLSLHSLFL